MMALCQSDYNGFYPPQKDTWKVMKNLYGVSSKVSACPKDYTEYHYLLDETFKVVDFEVFGKTTSKIPVIICICEHTKGKFLVCFMDGHVEEVKGGREKEEELMTQTAAALGKAKGPCGVLTDYPEIERS